MKKQVTIKEIARMAGVSVSTVSRVLNHKPNVAPAKIEKVNAAIESAHFQPSMLARGMVSRKTNTLAIVVPDITNPYFTALIAQIELLTRKEKYSLLVFNTMTAGDDRLSDSVLTEIDAFKTIAEKKVDGVLILGGEIDRQEPSVEYLSALKNLEKQIPTVIVGQKVADLSLSFVPRFQKKSGEIITQHLLARGFRKIGFLGGEPNVRITNERLAGYQQMMSTYANFDEQLILLGDYYTRDGYEVMKRFIESNSSLPEAFVAINDQVALGAIRALSEKGLNCPTDVAIGSCDAFPNSEFYIPSVTTIDHHNDAIAQIALQKLMALINEEVVETTQLPQPTLLIRESCGTQQKRGV